MTVFTNFMSRPVIQLLRFVQNRRRKVYAENVKMPPLCLIDRCDEVMSTTEMHKTHKGNADIAAGKSKKSQIPPVSVSLCVPSWRFF